MLRLVGDIDKMEKADREDQEARALGRSVRASMEAHLAQDEARQAPAEASQTAGLTAGADPSLYFPVNSESAGTADRSAAAPDGTAQPDEASAGAPLGRAA
jgi:hypothetical protein